MADGVTVIVNRAHIDAWTWRLWFFQGLYLKNGADDERVIQLIEIKDLNPIIDSGADKGLISTYLIEERCCCCWEHVTHDDFGAEGNSQSPLKLQMFQNVITHVYEVHTAMRRAHVKYNFLDMHLISNPVDVIAQLRIEEVFESGLMPDGHVVS